MKIHLLAGLALLALAAGKPAWSENIAEVLERSQSQRLDALTEADAANPGAVALRESFARLQRERRPQVPAELKVVDVGSIADTMHGHVIVLNSALGQLPEICRLFLLAHELGHVQQHHWEQRIALYQRYIPGEVRQAETDAIAPRLGREASEQAHQQEFEADAYAMRTMLDMGFSRDDLLSMFMRLGNYGATATHPSSSKRMLQLRMIDDERQLAHAGAAGADPVK